MRKFFDYSLILVIFAVTGSTAAYLGKPILQWMNITRENVGTGWYIFLYILVITPIYQVLLLGYAWIFGKYHYFLEKQKRLFARLFPFSRKQS